MGEPLLRGLALSFPAGPLTWALLGHLECAITGSSAVPPDDCGRECDHSIRFMERETPSLRKATLLVQGQEEKKQ